MSRRWVGADFRNERASVTALVPHRRPPSILCVEDHDETRAVLLEILSAEGFDVATAASVREARLALELQGRFDLIMTDYALPDGTGTSLLQSVLAHERRTGAWTTPMLLFTGETGRLDTGDITTLRKPCGAERLLCTLRELLDRADSPAIAQRAG